MGHQPLKYPRHSDIVPISAIEQKAVEKQKAPVQLTLRKQDRESFLESVSPRVRALVNQPFGKENLLQCFKSEARFSHVLIPLWKSGYLPTDDWDILETASHEAATLMTLIRDVQDLDFAQLQGFRSDDFMADTAIDDHRVRLTTAALIYFDGDPAALVRWMGGSHVGAHRSQLHALAYMKGKIPDDVHAELSRIFLNGIPKCCNVSASNDNYEAFVKYGNHPSCTKAPEKTYKALVKDAKQGFVIPFDQRALPFVLNCHVTPQGVVDLDRPHKNPRPIFDSSFRPFPWCAAINDWTSKTDELPVICACAEIPFMVWLWNLRISYPRKELYIGGTDCHGAFRWDKHNPNLVGMHTSVQAGYAVFNTGGTFGGCTTPSNWDVVARAIIAMAKYLWLNCSTVVEQAAIYLPTPLEFETELYEPEGGFSLATPDAIHRGVFDENGNRLPPQFDHHVDDACFADIKEYFPRTFAACLIAMYVVIGFPQKCIPNPLSTDKFEHKISYQGI